MSRGNPGEALARLRRIAGLARDAALADLRRAGQACDESRALLAALEPRPLAADAGPALHRAAALHQIWADGRRAEINLVLAQQRAAWIEARARAATASGRVQALDGLPDAGRSGRLR